MEFPSLGGQKHLSDGFGHIVESVGDESEQQEAECKPNDSTKGVISENEKDVKIAELVALLAENTEKLKQSKAKASDSSLKKSAIDPEVSKVAKLIIEQKTEIIEYDQLNDKVVTKDEKKLAKLMEEYCSKDSKNKKDRDQKLSLLRNKVFEKVRIYERNRLGISSSRSRSNSQRRARSDESDSDDESKKSRSVISSQPSLLSKQ